MDRLVIETFVLGPDETNCFLLSSGDRCAVVDVGVEPARMIDAVAASGKKLEAVWLTHFHLDHVGGVAELLARFKAPVYASGGDEFLKDISLEGGGIREFVKYVDFPYERVEPGKRTLLGQPMMVLDTPGHTPGSLSFFLPASGCVFVGDLIFMIAVGRTDIPRGNSSDLLDSIRSRIFNLPDDTRIYSGHGPMTTVGHEKANNPHFIL